MADDSNKVVIELVLDKSQIPEGLDKVAVDFGKAGENSGKSFTSGFATIFKGNLLANIATDALRMATRAVKDFASETVAAAMDQQDSMNQLNNALIQTGRYSDQASRDMANFATSLQLNSRFTDDAVLKNAALIQSLGRLSTDGLKNATQAAADFAAGTGMSFDAASAAIAKATSGNILAFQRLGFQIQEGATANETFLNTLKAIESQFGGRAAADITTYSGRMDQLKKAVGELQESLGNIVINSPLVNKAIEMMTNLFNEIITKIQTFVDSGALKTVIDDAIKYLDRIILVVGGIGEGVVNLFLMVTNAVAALINGSVSRLSGMFASLFENIGLDSVAEKLNSFSETTLSAFNQNLQATKDAWNGAFSFEAVDQARAVLSELAAANQEASNTVTNANNQTILSNSAMANSFGEGAKKSAQALQTLNAVLKVAVQQGIVNTVAAMTTALTKGENVMKVFLKSLLGAIGDLMVSFGSSMVSIGVATELLKMSMFSLVGAPAILAGMALIAAGTALKVYAGSMGGAASVASSAGTGASAGAGSYGDVTSSGTGSTADDRREEQKVQVVINGNVFDTQETGLRIVEILNKSFETDGTRLVTA